jgi:hypothetical protein
MAADLDVFHAGAERARVEEPAVPVYAAAARGVGGISLRSKKDSSSRRGGRGGGGGGGRGGDSRGG